MSGIKHDVENQLSVNQVFTGAAAVTTNSYAKQAAAQDLSIGTMGTKIAMVVYLSALPTGNLTLELIEATDAALTTSISVLNTATVPVAQLKVGKPIVVPFPMGSDAGKQYIGGRVTAATGSATANIYLMKEEDIAIFPYKSFPKVVEAVV